MSRADKERTSPESESNERLHARGLESGQVQSRPAQAHAKPVEFRASGNLRQDEAVFNVSEHRARAHASAIPVAEILGSPVPDMLVNASASAGMQPSPLADQNSPANNSKTRPHAGVHGSGPPSDLAAASSSSVMKPLSISFGRKLTPTTEVPVLSPRLSNVNQQIQA